MVLLIKNEQGAIQRSPTKGRIDLIESFISFLLTENSLDLNFLKTLHLISHIDLYADTYVNSTQALMYIEEFQKLLSYTKDEKLREYCALIIDELKKLDRCYFLVFSGD